MPADYQIPPMVEPAGIYQPAQPAGIEAPKQQYAFGTYPHLDSRYVHEVRVLLAGMQSKLVTDADLDNRPSIFSSISSAIKRAPVHITFCNRATDNSAVCHKEIEFARKSHKVLIGVFTDPLENLEASSLLLQNEYQIDISEKPYWQAVDELAGNLARFMKLDINPIYRDLVLRSLA